jgi:hypothetical protein
VGAIARVTLTREDRDALMDSDDTLELLIEIAAYLDGHADTTEGVPNEAQRLLNEVEQAIDSLQAADLSAQYARARAIRNMARVRRMHR